MSDPVMKMPGSSDPATLEAMRNRLQRRRKMTNAIALTLSLAAMAFGLLWLVWILFTTLRLGIGGLSVELFTQSTPPPNTDGGGLANAIVGSLMLVAAATWMRRTMPLVMAWTSVFLFFRLLAGILVDGLHYDARWRLIDMWNNLRLLGSVCLEIDHERIWPQPQPEFWEAAVVLGVVQPLRRPEEATAVAHPSSREHVVQVQAERSADLQILPIGPGPERGQQAVRDGRSEPEADPVDRPDQRDGLLHGARRRRRFHPLIRSRPDHGLHC